MQKNLYESSLLHIMFQSAIYVICDKFLSPLFSFVTQFLNLIVSLNLWLVSL